MEAVAPQAPRLKTAWQRQLLRYPGHIVMKSRVETRKLGQRRITPARGFDEHPLAGQMLGVEDAKLPQLGLQRERDALGRVVRLPCTTRCPTA